MNIKDQYCPWDFGVLLVKNKCPDCKREFGRAEKKPKKKKPALSFTTKQLKRLKTMRVNVRHQKTFNHFKKVTQ